MAIKRNAVEEAKEIIEEPVKKVKESIEEPVVEVKETKKEEKPSTKKEKKKIYIVNQPLNFREGAAKNFNVIKVLSAGDEIEVSKIENGWAECSFNKTKGYVMAQYITLK